MAAIGYFPGDLHLHFARLEEADDQAIFDLLEAEDIDYGFLLAYNEPPGPYDGLMVTMASPQRRSWEPPRRGGGGRSGSLPDKSIAAQRMDI